MISFQFPVLSFLKMPRRSRRIHRMKITKQQHLRAGLKAVDAKQLVVNISCIRRIPRDVNCPLSIVNFFFFLITLNCRFAIPTMEAERTTILGNNCPNRWPSSQQMAAAPSFPQNWHEV
jgi:hypothetical protein